MPHIPVLLQEVIQMLNPQKGNTIADGTLGAGGHAREIIKCIMPKGVFLGCDKDNAMLQQTKEEIEKAFGEYKENIHCVLGSYKDMVEIAQKNNIGHFDGVLLDLGFSSWHIDESKRGFSFQKDEPLDMRYDQSQETTAEMVIQLMPQKDLADIIWEYGEERFSRKIAAAIVERRKKMSIKTTADLVEIITNALPAHLRHGRINPATKTFQALRIYVNDELGALKDFLDTILEYMNPESRVAIISFHSLEDRIVKQTFREWEKQKKVRRITKKPITPQDTEIKQNPKSRSAKLRVIEII